MTATVHADEKAALPRQLGRRRKLPRRGGVFTSLAKYMEFIPNETARFCKN